MTPEQLKLLTDDERAAWGRCEKATTGPWHAMQANARTDLPAALEEIARLRAKIAHLDALGRRRKRREAAALAPQAYGMAKTSKIDDLWLIVGHLLLQLALARWSAASVWARSLVGWLRQTSGQDE